MKTKIKTSAVILGISVGLLLLLEGTGRLVIRYLEYKKPSGVFGEAILSHQEPLIGFGLKKNLNSSMGAWNVRTNALGFRSSEFDPENAKQETRIFVVGGSTVFGWGVEESESIPSLLQAKINQLGYKNIRVVNAGIPWYASWHEAALIFFRVLQYHPSYIITLNGLNDTAQGIAPEWAPVSSGYIDPPTRVALERKLSDPSKRPFLFNLLSLSQTFSYFSAKMNAREGLKKGVYHPELWEQYIALKQRLNHIALGSNIRLSTIFQPVIVLDKELDDKELARNETAMRFPEFAESFRKVYLEGEKALLSAKNLNALSLREAFKNVKEAVYIDGQHYNGKGNQILADLILEKEILPQLKSITQRTEPKHTEPPRS